jgi:hypothetical protein
MAGRGPAPKPADQKRNRRIDPIGTSHLVDDGQRLGPDLTELTGRKDWPPMVIKWFETWRAAPQAKQFIDTDWQRLGLVAYLYEQYLIEPKSTILSEIRLNEERLGATVVDRQRARMVVETSDSKNATVLQLAPGSSARDRIAKRTEQP